MARAVRTVFLLISGTAMAALGSCDPDPGECVPWIEEGGEYRIVVGRAVDLALGFVEMRDRCGESFDLAPGDTFTIKEAGRNFEDAPGECYYHDITIDDVPDVELRAREGGGRDADHFLATQRRDSTVRGVCTGSYQLGLILHEGDIVIFREFFPADIEACSVPGSELDEESFGCADMWYGRVETLDGRVLEDFPEDGGV